MSLQRRLQRLGLMASLSSPSQLLRDLDSCNSDPVAVASCFVERVRGAGSLFLGLSSETWKEQESPTQ